MKKVLIALAAAPQPAEKRAEDPLGTVLSWLSQLPDNSSKSGIDDLHKFALRLQNLAPLESTCQLCGCEVVLSESKTVSSAPENTQADPKLSTIDAQTATLP